MMTNISYEEVLYLMKGSNLLIKKLAKALKKCLKENHEIVCAGLCMMNAGTYVPTCRR